MLNQILPKLLENRRLNQTEQKQLNTVIKQIFSKKEEVWTAEEAFVVGYLNEQDQRYTKAIPYYELAIEKNPTFEAAYHNLGSCFAETGELQAALSQFEKALELDPTYVSAQVGKATLLRRTGNASEAIALLSSIDADEDDVAEIESELSACYEQNGDTANALEHINKAIERNPKDANFLAQRALILLFSESYESALKDFLESQKIAGINYVTQFNLGLCYGMIPGKDKDANQMFTRSFTKFPGLLKDYFSNATEHESNRLEKQLEKIIARLNAMDASAPGKFYRDELTDLLQRKLDDALNSN